jgi:hypothetical protein
MVYNPATDFLGLWRNIAGQVSKVEMPGLDYVVAALARAGLITLSVSATAPVVSQSVTAWLNTAVPSYSGEGVLYLWNTALDEYVAATPALFFDMLQTATGQNGVSWWASTGGPPANVVGNNGDFAIRTDEPGGIYGPKATGAWPALPLPGTTDIIGSTQLDETFGTTEGALIVRGPAVWQALELGAADTVLTSVGGLPAWGNVSNLLDTLFGDVQGSIFVRGAGGWETIGPSTAGSLLTTEGFGADPAWIAPPLAPMLNALNYGVVGDGVTNDNAAINAFLTTANTAGAVAFFPGNHSYNNGNGVITVPDYSTVLCGTGATFIRSTDIAGPSPYEVYTQAFIILGNHCRWSGGTLSNTAVLATSATSNTVATGAISFTTQTGLPLAGGVSFVRIWSRANPANRFEGTVSAYNPTTGALVLNAVADGGSGTFTDWNITFGAVYQCPIVLHGVTESTVEFVRAIGNWYAGLVMDGWNPSSGGSLAVTFCTLRNCFLESVQNRGIYLYGTCNDNVVSDNFIQGTSLITDYGLNCDPANAVGNVNSQSRNKISGNTVIAAAFQGFEFGDQCFYAQIVNNSAVGISNAAGVGFLVQYANGLAPQYNILTGNTAVQCSTGFVLSGCLYTVVTGGSAVAGLNGYVVQNNTAVASENSLQDILATGNAVGVSIGSGAVNTLVTGRSVANTSNLTDAGTGTISTNLVQT